jgi:hypothetical protein
VNIVESEEILDIFLKRISTDMFFMEVVVCDHEKHAYNNKISLIFVKFMVDDDDCWCLPINHNEARILSNSLEKFISSLETSSAVKLVRNKKDIIHLFGKDFGFIDLGVVEYLENGNTSDQIPPETNSHIFIKNNFRGISDVNCSIPLYKHATVFKKIKMADNFSLKCLSDEGFKFVNNIMTNCFAELESIGMRIDDDKFIKVFGSEQIKHIKDHTVYSQYNLFTSTGRPSNRFGGVNYAALNKTDGSRNSFVSRHGNSGMLIMMDYNAFHPRLVARLVNYPISFDTNPYEYLAKYYFNKPEVDEEDVAVSKVLTFQQMYGGIDNKWMYIPFFIKTQEYIDHRWKFFKQNGYVETPVFKRKIKDCHIENPSPNKLFNYILQAYETEMAVETLKKLLKHCVDRKTKPILYTYDSILFDVHKDDKIDIIKELKKIMESDKFPVKLYTGRNYAEMQKIDLS